MNQKTFEDIVDNDVNTVIEDGQNSIKRLAQSTDKMKNNLVNWVEDSVAQLNRKLLELKSNTTDKLAATSRSIEQDVDQGLHQYNGKVQDFVDQIPGGFSQKIGRYPWVTISFSLAIGVMLGLLLQPKRRLQEWM